MANVRKNTKRSGTPRRAARVSSARLDAMIAEATVDCYNESEEATGLFTMLEQNLAVPFTATVLDVDSD